MTSERELITLAFGNYASLVAAQWANGTTEYDLSRETLYSECCVSAICGGETNQQRTGMVARVPRIIFLDAPHATRLKFTQSSVYLESCMKEEEPKGTDVLGIRGGNTFTINSEITKWGSSSSSTSSNVQRDDEEEEVGAEEERKRQECAEDISSSCENGVSFKDMKSIKLIKRELFKEKDELVPWWQYIRSGVRNDSVHVLHPLRCLNGAVGDVPLLHSFGFGMSQLCSSHSVDIAGMTDSLRRQIENADYLQGIQCFADGDSAFAGAACNVMEEFWEDAGEKIPAVFFTSFHPLSEEIMMPGSEVDFADRRKDEACLNRLLATSHMTKHDSSVYVPFELALWRNFFAEHKSNGTNEPAWLQNDTATAQLIAMVADTALYGARDDGSIDGTVSRPSFYMHDWVTTVRPTRGLRVAAALAALPLHIHSASLPRNDLWDFLHQYPLLSTPSAGNRGCFVPLTHPVRFDPQTEAGRVLGHALTLRGAGKLLDLTYPRQEALLRYGFPLRTANYLPLITKNSYPISSTFPRDFVVPRELLASNALKEIDVGSHVLSTYDSAPMLQEIVTAAQKVLRRRQSLYEDTYGMDGDEWKDVIEDVLQIRDDYDHHEADNEDNDVFD